MHIEERWSVEIGACTYEHGHRSVEMIDAKSVSKRLARLEHGLRLSVLAHVACDPFRMVELQQARVKTDAADSWSSLFGAEQWDLDAGAGADVFSCLRRLGAGKVARRSEVTERGGSRNRGPYVALCTVEDWRVPIAAYVLTRVLPIHRQFRL